MLRKANFVSFAAESLATFCNSTLQMFFIQNLLHIDSLVCRSETFLRTRRTKHVRCVVHNIEDKRSILVHITFHFLSVKKSHSHFSYVQFAPYSTLLEDIWFLVYYIVVDITQCLCTTVTHGITVLKKGISKKYSFQIFKNSSQFTTYTLSMIQPK